MGFLISVKKIKMISQEIKLIMKSKGFPQKIDELMNDIRKLIEKFGKYVRHVSKSIKIKKDNVRMYMY